MWFWKGLRGALPEIIRCCSLRGRKLLLVRYPEIHLYFSVPILCLCQVATTNNAFCLSSIEAAAAPEVCNTHFRTRKAIHVPQNCEPEVTGKAMRAVVCKKPWGTHFLRFAQLQGSQLRADTSSTVSLELRCSTLQSIVIASIISLHLVPTEQNDWFRKIELFHLQENFSLVTFVSGPSL